MKLRFLSRGPVSIVFTILALAYLPMVDVMGQPYCAIVKILPIYLLVAAIASAARESQDPKAHKLAIVALVFSSLGDIAGDFKVILGDSAFIAQIAFFAIAQFVLANSFSRYSPKGDRVSGFRNICGIASRLLIILYLVFFGSFLMGHISGVMYVPTGIYMTLIASMFLTCTMQDRDGYLYFLAGAALFILSDSAIAYSAFVGDIPFRDQIVMYTYYAAQLLLNIKLTAKR